MRSPLRWTLLVIGVVLVLPFVFAAGKKPVDEALAEQPIKTFPLNAFGPGLQTFSVRIPDSAEWTNIRKQWGDPGYFIGVTSSSKAKYLRCIDGQQLRVSLQDAGGRPLMAQSAEGAPYGYSAECPHPGVRFASAPGSVVMVRVDLSRELASSGDDLIVAPFWDSGVKDHMVGSLLGQALAPVSNISAIIGAVLLAASLVLFRSSFHNRRTA
jgi:nitrite reductase/ring-hydroxylating ferredoxin subunit